MQMNKSSFLQDQNVKDFIDWCNNKLATLQVNLDINRSRFVPQRINVTCRGLEEVLQHYSWKAAGMQNGSWNETVNHLTQMTEKLRNAVDSQNNVDALDACKYILEWGGNRNYKVGAYPFLSQQTNLCEYLKNAGDTFKLETANLTQLAGPNLPVRLMNSMLTKVHAFYALDGLPIYDSRVAAAIATLIELWRQESNKKINSLPDTLKFPATVSTRTVLDLFPDAKNPGLMVYGNASTTIQWSGAKVRLGWLMKAIINVNLFNEIDEALRMRAFEASLFMLGYDVTCLGNKTAQSNKKANKSVKELQKKIRLCTPSDLRSFISVETLSGKSDAQSVRFSGDIQNGIYIRWGASSFFFEPTVLEELEEEFGERLDVPLGAEQSGKGLKDSLGVWLNEAHKISPRWASALAPVLVNIGSIRSYNRRRGIYLDFA
jgi:hypothetical protein